jgi:hypothetical protein
MFAALNRPFDFFLGKYPLGSTEMERRKYDFQCKDEAVVLHP